MKSRRMIWMAAVSLLVLVLAAIPALAGHQTSGVQSETGCLTALHKLIKVAIGDAPSSPCDPLVGQIQVHFSGGDITSVTAGTGLNISGGDVTGSTVTDGAVTLNAALHLVGGPGTSIAAGGNGTAFAGCAANEIAIAGGVRWDPVSFPASNLVVEMEGPSFRIDGTVGAWRVDGHNGTAGTETLLAFALCMKA